MIGLGSPFVPLGALPTKMGLAVDVICRKTCACVLAGAFSHHGQAQRVRAAADRTPSAVLDRVGDCLPLVTLRASPSERRSCVMITPSEERRVGKECRDRWGGERCRKKRKYVRVRV